MSKVERLFAQKNVRGLCRCLKDRNTLIRRQAVQALGQLRDPTCVDDLEATIRRDQDEYVRRWAMAALGLIGTQKAIDALTSLMFSTGRQMSGEAAGTLSTLPDSAAVAALQLRDVLTRNDWQALEDQNLDVSHALTVVLNSKLYATWPSGKRKKVLEAAVRSGSTPPAKFSKELAESGLFVSGLHTVQQVVSGLNHRSPQVRIEAARKLGASGQSGAAGPLYRHFRKEVESGEHRQVIIALAQALEQLGDNRAITYYKKHLTSPDSRLASNAGRMLAEIGTRQSVETLFWFVTDPPPPPAYRNTPLILTAMESAGATTVEALRHLVDHEDARARLLLIDIILRCGHPEAVSLLATLGRDDAPGVQRAALDALAEIGSAEAIETLTGLAADGQAPKSWVVRALASTSHPDAPKLLRKLAPDATTVHGVMLEDDGSPIDKAELQIIREHYFGENAGWGWQAISNRAVANRSGEFGMTVFMFEQGIKPRIKVILPPKQAGKPGETFMAEIDLLSDRANHFRIRIERFLMRLLITSVREDPEE